MYVSYLFISVRSGSQALDYRAQRLLAQVETGGTQDSQQCQWLRNGEEVRRFPWDFESVVGLLLTYTHISLHVQT